MECCFGFVASSDGTWVDDFSEAVKAKGGSFQVKGKAPGDSPVNARFSKSLTSGQYFEVKIADLRGHAAIGVTTEAGFKKGYGIRGLLFNGNLSNGNQLIKADFGDFHKTGDVIGVLFESCRILSPVKEETVTVTFYQNGRCLGPAYVSKMLNPGTEVFPVISAGSEGDKFMIRFGKAPTQRLREGKTNNSPYEGTWALKQFHFGPELRPYPLAQKIGAQSVTMNVEMAGRRAAPGTFRFSARVANVLNFIGVSKANASLKPFEELELTAPMSTMMMGPPSVMEVEDMLKASLTDIRKWIAQPDTLLLQGPTAELSFERRKEVVAPEENVPLP
eukprot:TRINITY_DN38752_c0_g1_i1.p1 TRINITY_DN38752_c0_g1~~TRINITY_DN38752_c0_g1_i1.p1  ORF type:complete len:333 (-),score=53.39 TRINITY_DN38752_c0_g1_i1:124-1122(-)